jgi:hypothetical protein
MVYKVPIEKHLNKDIDLCIPNLRTRIMNLAISKYRVLYKTLEEFFNDKNSFKDYQRLIQNPDIQSPYPKVRIPQSEYDFDYVEHGFEKQIFDMSLIEIGDESDDLPDNTIKSLVEYQMEKYGYDYLGLDPRQVDKSDSIEQIIKHCLLDYVTYTPTYRQETDPKVPLDVYYNPIDLQILFSTYSKDTKYFNDAKRSAKDIPESKALQIFNECFSVANRENSKISAYIRQSRFYDAFLELRNINEVSTNDTQVEWANKILSLTFQEEGHESESLMAFNTRFQKHLRILCIIRSIRTKEKSRKIIFYADRPTQEANSWTMSNEKITNKRNSAGDVMVEYLTETDRTNWYLDAMRRNEQNIFSDVVGLQAILNNSFVDIVTQVYDSYQRHISTKIKDIKDSQNLAKAAKLLTKNIENRNKRYPFDKKRKLDEPMKVNGSKYHCTMHGDNDQHDTDHCHIVKQALLAFKESAIKKQTLQNSQTTKAQKVTKPITTSNITNPKVVVKPKTTNFNNKSNPKPKANLIISSSSSNQIITNDNKVKPICDICRNAGKGIRAFTTHSTSECTFNPIKSSDQSQVDIDEQIDEEEEVQEETIEEEIDEGEESEESRLLRHGRKLTKKSYYKLNTVEDDECILNYNQTSDDESEREEE